MPIYEYKCEKCGLVEVIQKPSEADLKECPQCAESGIKSVVSKLVSAAAFHLKGSGWYKTDYASSGSGSANSASATSTASDDTSSKSSDSSSDSSGSSGGSDSSSGSSGSDSSGSNDSSGKKSSASCGTGCGCH